MYTVRAKLNELISLSFVVDSGAADVIIPEYIAKTLFAGDILTKQDVVGNSNYRMANGIVTKGVIVNIKKFSLGNIMLHDVRAAIVKGEDGELLMGQSVLGRLGKWRINANMKRLEIE